MLKSFFFTCAVLLSSFSFAQTELEISDEKLQKFAKAFQVVQQETMKVQQQMMGLIQDAGLEPQRFNEMYQAANNPDKEVEATPEEQAKFDKAVAQIEKMQTNIQTEMEAKIKASGMEVNAYEFVMKKMQTDPELQKRLQAIMMKNSGQ